ncbi:hypothetical protein GCM10020295_10520 [Streptomyces cinereospinus]
MHVDAGTGEGRGTLAEELGDLLVGEFHGVRRGGRQQGVRGGQTRAARRMASSASIRARGPNARPVASVPAHTSAASATSEGSLRLCTCGTARKVSAVSS